MSNHTPGPWKWICGDTKLISEDKTIISTEYPFGDPTEADAHLIAAAPDLLEALENLILDCDFWITMGVNMNCNFVDQAKAAIAKAKGESESESDAPLRIDNDGQLSE